MTTAAKETAALLAVFRRYCGEVLRLERQVAHPAAAAAAQGAGAGGRGAAGSGGAGGSGSGSSGGSSSAQSAYDTVRLKLTPYLQPLPAAAAGGAGAQQVQQAQYLMAVFADDVFLYLDWPGQAAWEAAPLEQEYFGTSDGGTVVFQRIQQLLAYPDAGDLAVAEMDLTVLGLGFLGEYRGDPDAAAELAAIRAQLWTLLAAGDPGASSGAGNGHLFPEAYRHTLDQGQPSTLPNAWGWVAAFVAAFLLWLAASAPIWQAQTADLVTTLDRITAPGGS